LKDLPEELEIGAPMKKESRNLEFAKLFNQGGGNANGDRKLTPEEKRRHDINAAADLGWNGNRIGNGQQVPSYLLKTAPVAEANEYSDFHSKEGILINFANLKDARIKAIAPWQKSIRFGDIQCTFGTWNGPGLFILVCGENSTPCVTGIYYEDQGQSTFHPAFLQYPGNPKHQDKCPQKLFLEQAIPEMTRLIDTFGV
jgi:hypothetical protein